MNVGVIGVGTVGTALLRQLHERRSEVERRLGEPLVVLRAAVRHPGADRACPPPALGYTADAGALVEDDRLDALVEVAGGEAWYEALAAALRLGRPVVTANKALLARRGPDLIGLARATGTALAFEAAVAGAVPVIRTLTEARAGERFRYAGGVLNGTANFVLGRMEAGRSYAEAIQEAQTAGLAEADPSDDVEGMDAARKLSILTQLAFGLAVSPDCWFRRGIRGLSPERLRAAGPGHRVKLLAQAWKTDEGAVTGYVGPTLVPARHALARADGPENVVLLDGEPGGPTALAGLGAGGEATASQVLADLVGALLHRSTRGGFPVPPAAAARAGAPRLRAFSAGGGQEPPIYQWGGTDALSSLAPPTRPEAVSEA